MEEIMKKIEKIKEVTGNSSVGFDSIDLDGDYDPDAYDKQMETIFNEDYYQTQDKKKPTWDDDLDISDIIKPESITDNQKNKKSKKNKNKKNQNKEDEFIMDADYLLKNQIEDSGVSGVNVNAEISDEKKQLSKSIEQYYQLNYEDIIDDLPTRFKYQKSKSFDFGLTPEEILLADEKDLNDLVSVKKLAPFRPEWKTSKDLKKASKNSVIKPLKKKISKNYKVWTEVFKGEQKNEEHKKKKIKK
ncbi:hypothetical protein BB561_001225 [Smittium simulii]|uniref:Kri1-like C-terminal domain-containing protein n=1 Tax=Smittium simulii TaxID=133385 RepID=A0A2T9YVJ6_9FUNG|nr:hypothetical protein BB561_001225 [Smittium simulii]